MQKKDSDPYRRYDEFLRKRLAAMIAAAGYTQQALADTIGVQRYRIHRLLSGDNIVIDASLTCAIAQACGQPPHVLYDHNIDLTNDELTGVASIDRMLRDAYNDTSPTGLDSLKKYAATDYRVLNARYHTAPPDIGHLLVDVEPAQHMGLVGVSEGVNRKLPAMQRGLQKRDEKAINALAAEQTKTNKQFVLADAELIDEMVWVQYTVDEYYETTRHSSSRRRLVDLLVLEHPIHKYRSNGRLKPRIRRRSWRLIKEPPGQQFPFATDWIGFQ